MAKNSLIPSYVPMLPHPLDQKTSAKKLESWGEAYRKGEKRAITEGLYLCAMCGFPMPEWLAWAYTDAYSKIQLYQERTWDDALGKPHPKGTSLSSKAKKVKFGLHIWTRISYIKGRWPEIPVDGKLFERVGEDLGKKFGLQKPLKKTFVSECYSEWKRSFAAQGIF